MFNLMDLSSPEIDLTQKSQSYLKRMSVLYFVPLIRLNRIDENFEGFLWLLNDTPIFKQRQVMLSDLRYDTDYLMLLHIVWEVLSINEIDDILDFLEVYAYAFGI